LGQRGGGKLTGRLLHGDAVERRWNGDGRPKERSRAPAGLEDVEVAPDGHRRRLASWRPSAADDAEGNRRGGSGRTVVGGAGAVVEHRSGWANIVDVEEGRLRGRRRLAPAGSSRRRKELGAGCFGEGLRLGDSARGVRRWRTGARR
jgi:hypothetical protein